MTFNLCMGLHIDTYPNPCNKQAIEKCARVCILFYVFIFVFFFFFFFSDRTVFLNSLVFEVSVRLCVLFSLCFFSLRYDERTFIQYIRKSHPFSRTFESLMHFIHWDSIPFFCLGFFSPPRSHTHLLFGYLINDTWTEDPFFWMMIQNVWKENECKGYWKIGAAQQCREKKRKGGNQRYKMNLFLLICVVIIKIEWVPNKGKTRRSNVGWPISSTPSNSWTFKWLILQWWLLQYRVLYIKY